MSATDLCHCGELQSLSECCGRFMAGTMEAETAEQLMRSRYSAYVERDEAYLMASWHPATRPSRVRLDPDQRWLGLSVKSVEAGQVEDSRGTVEYVARYKVQGRGHRLHEISRFERIGDRWYYRDGEHR